MGIYKVTTASGTYNVTTADGSSPTPPQGGFWKGAGNAAGAVGNFLTRNEQNFSQDIAGGLSSVLPGSVTGLDSLNKAQQTDQQTAQINAKTLASRRAAGQNTSAQTMAASVNPSPSTSYADLYPAVNKSNLQVLGDAAGVAGDIASMGSYGKAAMAAGNTGKLLVNEGSAIGGVASKLGIPIAERTVAPAVQIAQRTLPQTLGNIALKTGTRSVIGGTTGYGYDVTNNLQNGKTGRNIFTPGAGTAIGATIPLGTGALEAAGAVSKSIAPKFINSLVKPSASNFAYGKNPGRAVSEMGITGNSLPDLGKNINQARNTVGSQIGQIISSPANANARVDGTNAINIIDSAIQDASKGGKNNQGIVDNLSNIKDALLYQHGTDAEGNIIKTSTTPLDVSALNPQQAFALKQQISNQTKFTGNPSDDKTVNAVLQNMYGDIKGKINKAVAPNNPEITKLNERYADLTSAGLAVDHRHTITQRANLTNLKDTGIGAGIGVLTDVLTGGQHVGAALAGLGAAGAAKLLGTTAVKSRIAARLGREAPGFIGRTLQQNPSVAPIVSRIISKSASALGTGETRPTMTRQLP